MVAGAARAAIADALAAEVRSLGGEIAVGHQRSGRAGRHPRRRGYASPTRPAVPGGHRRRSPLPEPHPGRATAGFRYGPGVVKVDWALDGPIPWFTPASPGPPRSISAARSTSSVAVRGGRRRRSGEASGRSRCSSSTAVGIRAASRMAAPRPGRIAMCPTARTVDASAAIEATGRALRTPGSAIASSPARSHRCRPVWRPTTRTTSAVTSTPGSRTGGNCSSARPGLARPVPTPARASTSDPSSTPPGGGVHGMAGYLAARSALRRDLR